MVENETFVRLSVFWGLLLILACTEYVWPKRKLRIGRMTRWQCNISLVVLNSVLLKAMMPITAVGAAYYAEQHSIGLLHYFEVPSSVELVASIIFLDMVIYAQHVAFHHIPLFWRIHKIHHIDQDIDVTTGLRFHPIEICLSAVIKVCAILLIGASLIAVIIFEVLLNATSMFNHSNLKLPAKLDAWLRLLVVTPDMHRVHHSIVVQETNSNFGFSLPWWDRLFNTYREQPQQGHQGMKIGLQEYQDEKKTGLVNMLILPFK